MASHCPLTCRIRRGPAHGIETNLMICRWLRSQPRQSSTLSTLSTCGCSPKAMSKAMTSQQAPHVSRQWRGCKLRPKPLDGPQPLAVTPRAAKHGHVGSPPTCKDGGQSDENGRNTGCASSLPLAKPAESGQTAGATTLWQNLVGRARHRFTVL